MNKLTVCTVSAYSFNCPRNNIVVVVVVVFVVVVVCSS